MARTKYNYPKMTTRGSGKPWKPSRFVMDAIQSAVFAANQAAKMGSKRPSSYSSSGYNKRRRRGRGYSNYGELAGKFYKVRKVGKKYWKRYAKGKQGEVNATIKHCRETSGTVTDSKCVWLTHTSMRQEDALWMLCAAYLRLSYKQEGVDITSWQDTNNGSIAQISIENYNTITNSYVITVLANIGATDTYATIVNVMRTAYYSLSGAYRPSRLLYKNSAGVYIGQVALQGARVSYYSKGSLKMQNQTVVSVGDDEQDVNNVPVYGKTYQYKGNVMQTKSYSTIIKLGYDESVDAVGAGSSMILQEPPQASSIVDCYRSDKIAINPGKIKSSVLTKKVSVSLGEFFKALKEWDVADNTYLTKTRSISLEKVLAVASNDIKIAYEHDLKQYLTLHLDRIETPPYNLV